MPHGGCRAQRDWGIVLETLIILLIFILTTIPPSRQSRATSLYTREARAAIILPLQTPIVRLKANKLCISLIFVLLQSLFFYFLRLIRLLGCCVFYSPLKFYDCVFTFNQLIIFDFGRFFRLEPEAYPEIGIIDAAPMRMQLHYCRNYGKT